jgi:hypothetical protein
VSRSINTTPLRVRLAQDPSVRRERHDHRLNDCNLPSITELVHERKYRYGGCQYVTSRWRRDIAWRCDCDWCFFHTPARTLRRSGRDVLSRVAGRAPDTAVLDEIDDVAVPRR